jgi:RHS repeat-associated protein
MEKRQKYVCSYDQAGNLVKTIPPTGVDAKHSDAIFLDEVSKARMNVKKGEAEQNNKVVPSHTLVTDYRYNTLNQVAAQQTPDAGQTKFFYDLLGRLAVSQNAQQKLDKKYSYTLYDNLGRISEVGQKPNVTDPDSKNPDLLQKWLEEDENREQITRTVYDLPYQNKQQENILKGFLEQKNLRNRVSYSMVFDKEPKADILGTHHSATYFSYDIHGNVDTLLQDFNEGVMKATGNRFKKIAYDYDLISGKVNAVHYQSGWQDQFHHKYFYDAENRLVDVYTSKDSLSWQKDARYSYYRHGPLAKTILGQNQVQGIDYAYTLQGWLKGVNSTAVDDGKFDMGEDGLNAKSLVARDAFGFGLHYFGGDYKAINNTVLPFAPIPNLVSLYNGNIAAMSVNIPKVGEPLLNSYKYDQLNRLTKMNTYKGLNPQTNNWNAIAIDDYGEEISYDANGNIQVYKRNGSAGKLDMDKMTYQYPKDINGKIVNNRLRYVHDEVNAGNYAEDIDSQTPLTLAQVKAEKSAEQQADNYIYDAIGNLIQDKKEGINKISWNVYGKIEGIEKQNSTITYKYDASGNRISKELQTLNNKLQTIYSRDASGNVMSTYTVDANINNGNLTQNEVHLYGSSRLGINEVSRNVQALGKSDYLNKINTFVTGDVRYELTDHRGNVMAVVSDKKLQHSTDNIVVDYYLADVVSATDYAPFGMSLSGRKFNASGYRFGFNGQMKDHDIDADGNHYTAEFWEYDARIGRRWNRDIISKADISDYAVLGNNPIYFIDPNGADWYKDTKGADKGQVRWYDGSGKRKGMSHIGATYDGYTTEQYGKKWMNGDNNGKKVVWEDMITVTSKVKGDNSLMERALQVSNVTKASRGEYDARPKPSYYDSNPLRTIFWGATIKPLLPIEDIDIYGSVQVKKTVDVPVGGQVFNGTMVQYGAQGGFTTKDDHGFYGDLVTLNRSYVNYKVPGTSTEVRVIPFSNALKTPLMGGALYGDFTPSIRSLTTLGVYRGITIQSDLVMSHNIQLGLRGKVETPKIGGYSVEAAAGARGSLKVPSLLSAIYNAITK